MKLTSGARGIVAGPALAAPPDVQLCSVYEDDFLVLRFRPGNPYSPGGGFKRLRVKRSEE